MINVLLVDDQELVRTGLRGILRTQFGFAIAGECADGTEVLEAVQKSNPDIVLMDVRMLRLDGVAATRLLRAEWPDLPVLASRPSTTTRPSPECCAPVPPALS
jgi:DNA-binding NarL/FixJ family response regulator